MRFYKEVTKSEVANLLHTMRQFFQTWVEMRHTVGYFL